MKWFIVFMSLVALVVGENCYDDALEACQHTHPDVTFSFCNAKFGKAFNYIDKLNKYLNMHVSSSFQYLMMSSHFGGYTMEREGFKKLYRKLSDTAWEDTIDMVKYIALRGDKAKLKPYEEAENGKSLLYQNKPPLSEVENLAKAVDIQKELAEEAHSIYKAVNEHDPEMGAFVEDKFMHKHAKTIRELVGYTTELMGLIDPKKSKSSIGLQLFLLDEYLNKNL